MGLKVSHLSRKKTFHGSRNTLFYRRISFCGEAYKYLMSHNHHTLNLLWSTRIQVKIMAECTLESNKYYFSRDVQKLQVQSMCKHLQGRFKLRILSWPGNNFKKLMHHLYFSTPGQQVGYSVANSGNPWVPASERDEKLLCASTSDLGLAQSLSRPFFFGMWSFY